MAREKFDYFKAFSSIAEQAVQEAQCLYDFVKDYHQSELTATLDTLHRMEHNADEISAGVFQHLAVDFITPLDREDIIAIAQLIDDVCDYVEDVVQRLYMTKVHTMHPRAQEMAKALLTATVALKQATDEFANFKKSKTLRGHIEEVNDIEESADRIYLESIRDLYANYSDDAIYIMSWETIFSLMEKAVDRADNTASAIGSALMKNS